MRLGITGRAGRWLERPAGRLALVGVGLLAMLAPASLFADPLWNSWVRGDDWEYLASSRTFDRAIANLFVPHNVHVVPAWRIVSWAVVASAGRLANLRPALTIAAYLVLAATVLAVGLFVGRESRRPAIGLAAMMAVGSTSLMYPAGTWFSASQAMAAGLATVATLLALQGWRRSGGAWRLVAASGFVYLAGACWTAGYVAGPVGTAYLLADRSRRSVRAAAVPLVVAVVAAGATFTLRRSAIDAQSRISFHGRRTEEAVKPWLGPVYTIQAIPERLGLGAIGLEADTTFEQSAVLLLAIGAAWVGSRRAWPSPMEAAGASLTLGSYLILWTFRTYLPFSSLRHQVPWYDAIPSVGAVLFLAGWWSGLVGTGGGPLRRSGVIGLLAFQAGLLVVNQHRADTLFRDDVELLIRPMTAREKLRFPVPSLWKPWAAYTASEFANRQDRLLARLDMIERAAQAAGIGREAIAKVSGRSIWPEPPVIEDADLLALPWAGKPVDPARVAALVGGPFLMEEPPRPPWIEPTGPWPIRPGRRVAASPVIPAP